MTSNQSIQPFILDSYQVLKKLGSGAYGHVWKVVQKSNKKTYALKKIFEAFQHSTDAQRTFRQISILKKISHRNIVQLHEVFIAKNNRDIYLVFQYMQTDLYHAIYENILESIHKKYVLYQLLVGTKYLHEMGLIHRDLKPSNVLLDSNCSSKICDFGLARLVKSYDKETSIMTEGVATRWYRSPEVLLGSTSYGYEADIWSIGCIMAEILIKNPMFPGSSTINQLEKILQFTGKPTQEDIASIDCEGAEKFIWQCGNIKQKSVKQLFGISADPLLVDLVYRILQFNPSKRLPIELILRHEYFEEVYNEADLHFGINKNIELQINDNIKLATEQYRDLIRNFESKKNPLENQKHLAGDFSGQRNESVKRDRSPIRGDKNEINRSKVSEVSPSSRSPQRFKEIKKMRQQSFSKLIGSEKMKKRSDSRDESALIDTQNKQKRNCQLFSELIKNKDSNRQGSKSRSRLNGKENIHSNNIGSGMALNVTNCLKKFDTLSTTSRVSFQGLKKTANIKFHR